MRRLTEAEVAQLYRLDPATSELELLASTPASIARAATVSATKLMLTALEGRSIRSPAETLWPELEAADLLVTPLTIGEDRIGLLCAGSRADHRFSEQDGEVARAIGHLAAVAIKRLELIERLTNANIVKDLFEALATGATAFAAGKAAEISCDLSEPYVIMCAEPTSRLEPGSVDWRAAADEIGSELRALVPRAAVEAGPGPVRAVLPLVPRRPQRLAELMRTCGELGQRVGAVLGVSDPRHTPGEAARAYREAVDAATIGRALLDRGGEITYSQLGAYRYLVHIPPEEAPRDRMRVAVDLLIAYDRRRHTALLDTLERYLAERSSVVESARALLIHPNTLRQRLGRIEELTGVQLAGADLLSLELAIKLARLHGAPRAATAPR